MAFPDRIETDRMVLRPYRHEDLDAVVDIMSNWAVTRWLSRNVPYPYRQQDGERFIAEAIRQFEDGSSIRYAIDDTQKGRHMAGIRVFSETPETEVGYSMHPDFWGRGRGTEILKAVVGAGFDGGVISCFVAQAAAENAGSRRILEKTGFKHHGKTPPHYARCGHQQGCDEFYRLNIEDWKLA